MTGSLSAPAVSHPHPGSGSQIVVYLGTAEINTAGRALHAAASNPAASQANYDAAWEALKREIRQANPNATSQDVIAAASVVAA